MIVSASRRCDIPAWEMDRLMDSLRKGYCDVARPFNAGLFRRVSLRPEDVECIVFWTRDPRPLIPHIREIENAGFRFYVHMTLTAYPEAIEPRLSRPDACLSAISALADTIGPERVLWRYDPIVVAKDLDADFHRFNFARLASGIEGRSKRVTFSLLDEYAHTAKRLARAGFPDAIFGSHRGSPALASPPEPYPALLADLAGMARSHSLEPQACAEPYDLSLYGIASAACIDAKLIHELFGIQVGALKDSGQRDACRCCPSVDIGSYRSCPSACAYCYAR
jgi:hypothetical protein